MTEQAQVTVKEGTIQFYDIDKLYFPEICFVCGKKAEKSLPKSILGSFSGIKESRKDYHLKIPICHECEKNKEIETSQEVAKLIVPTIIGIIVALVINFFTASIFMGLAIGIFSFLFPFINCMIRINSQVNIKKHLQIQTMCFSKDAAEDILQLTFLNKNYTDYLGKLNLKNNEVLQLVDDLKEKEKKKIAISPSVVSKSDSISNMKTCPSCKNPNPVDNNFCIKCGYKIDMLVEQPSVVSKSDIISNMKTCPSCKGSNPVDNKFCIKCGNKIDMKVGKPSVLKTEESVIQCSNCQVLVSSKLTFCVKCGNKLEKKPDYTPIPNEHEHSLDTLKPIEIKEPSPKPKIIPLTPITVEIESTTLLAEKDDKSDTITCPKCKEPNQNDSIFCTNCGINFKKNDIEVIANKEVKEQKIHDVQEKKTTDLEMLKHYKQIIQYEISLPRLNDSPEGIESLDIANEGIKLFKGGQEMKAIELMIKALKLGVQEPEYSFIKRMALGYIDDKLLQNENKI